MRIVVPSLEPLHVYGESSFRLAPLAVPAPFRPASLAELGEVPSVEMFVDRAQAVRPGFAMTAENRAVVTELCNRLEGVPLGIEAAAARLKISSPQVLLAELEDEPDGAEAVARTTGKGVSDLLSALVDKSVLVPDEQADGELVFSMLGITRRYVFEELCRPEQRERARPSRDGRTRASPSAP